MSQVPDDARALNNLVMSAGMMWGVGSSFAATENPEAFAQLPALLERGFRRRVEITAGEGECHVRGLLVNDMGDVVLQVFEIRARAPG